MEHTFAATAAALLLTGVLVTGIFLLDKKSSPKEKVLSENSVSFEEKEPERAVLGVFEGKLALFKGESPYPNIVYDFFVRNLPKEDQNRLFEGISVSSEKELDSLLEDFMS